MKQLTITTALLLGLAAGMNVRAQQAGHTATFAGKEYRQVEGRWTYYDAATQKTYPMVERTITVKFKNGAKPEDAADFEKANNLQVLRKNVLGYIDYQLPENADIFAVATAMSQNPLVESVDLNSFGEYVITPNDPDLISQWYINTISAPNAWNISTGTTNVVVGILDSGTDWDHEDLGMGTDGYQNIYLNGGEDAWTTPNNPATGNGIDDDGNGLVDDWKGWNFDAVTNDSRGPFFHGTHVAGIVAAKTNNATGMAGVAGGWGAPGTRMLICGVGNFAPNGAVIDDAILYSIAQGAQIIQLSLSVAPTAAINAAAAFAESQGVIIVCAAGNGSGAPVAYPANIETVISVSASNSTDNLASFSNLGPDLDLGAPGDNIWSTQIGNTYAYSSGTSFAAPIVSGVAALLIHANPCMRDDLLEDILKNTADKVGGYNYYWDPIQKPTHSQEFGYGRINAEKAVKASQASYSATIDLMSKDWFTDIGLVGVGGTGSTISASPDIWVRNTNDGFTNQWHENPEFQMFSPCYVYVRVWNKSCVPSPASATLQVHWSKAATSFSWPANWDGTNPTVGDFVNVPQSIPVLQPGESTILEFVWWMIDPYVNNTWHSCLHTRIEGIPGDPITIYPGNFWRDILDNNNITSRNVNIVDNVFGMAPPPVGPVLVGNSTAKALKFDVRVAVPNLQLPHTRQITNDADVRLIFDQAGWTIIQQAGQLQQPGITVVGEREVRITKPNIVFKNLAFAPNQRFSIQPKFNFPATAPQERAHYAYMVSQFMPGSTETMIGAYTYLIRRRFADDATNPGGANGGDDQTINIYWSTSLTATDVGADATYKWFDAQGNLIHTGREVTVSPLDDQTYRLEVTSATGERSYDEVTVHVKKFYLVSLTPNPASSEVTVTYEASQAQSASLMVVDLNGKVMDNINIKGSDKRFTINTANFVPGGYSVVLVCNGERVDARTLIIK